MGKKEKEEEFNKTLLSLNFEIQKINEFAHHSCGPLHARNFNMLKFHLFLIEGFVLSARVMTDQLISLEKEGFK